MKRGMKRKYKTEIVSVMRMDGHSTSTSRCWNCDSHSNRYSDEAKKKKGE